MKNQFNSDENIDLSWSENSEDSILENGEKEDEKRKNRLIALIKASSMMILATVLLIIVGIAWFTLNKDVGTEGMGIKSVPAPFELEVRGDNIEYLSAFPKADPNYTLGELQSGTTNYYQTTGTQNKVIWRKVGVTSDDGHYPNGLEPNSHGKLSFWVVPYETGDLNIQFRFNLRGFISTETEPEDPDELPELDKLFEITSSLTPTAENGLNSETEAQDAISALNYLKGHILFFSDYDSLTGYYSGFLGTERGISFGNCLDASGNKYAADGGAVAVTAGTKYPVTIYWKWANTFEQMVLDENSPQKDNPIIVSTNTADRTAIYTYLGDTTHNDVFLELTSDLITTDLEYVRTDNVEHADAARTTLTNAYNNADSYIGNNVDYIMIEMLAGTIN